MSLIKIAVATLSILLFCSSARAIPVEWTLAGVTFDDGGTASGSFTFNAASNSILDFNINVSGGNTGIHPALVFQPSAGTGFVLPNSNPLDTLFFNHNVSGRQFRITPLAALTDAGGLVQIDLATAFGGSGSADTFNFSPARLINAGSLTGAAISISEPGSLGLVAIAIVGIGLARRKSAR